MSSDLAVISGTVYGCREVFRSVLSDQSISFEREAEFAVQLLSASDFATKTARSNPQSVINAVTNIAAIGISLNPARKLAYLVPRDHAIKLDISYMGLMEIAIATGSVKWAQAATVHENDTFKLQGYGKPPTHDYEPFGGKRGGMVGVYVVAKLPDGDYLTEAMDTAEILGIRDRSDAWKAFQAKKIKSCPWSTDPGEMSKKTCVKRAYKYWPKTPRLDQAIHYLNTDGGEGLAIKAEAAPPALEAAQQIVMGQARDAAAKGRSVFAKWWKEASPDMREFLRGEIDDLKLRTASADALIAAANAPPPEAPDAEFVAAMERAEGAMQ